jgi:protein SCO1
MAAQLGHKLVGGRCLYSLNANGRRFDGHAPRHREFEMKIISILFVLLLLSGAGIFFALQNRRSQEPLAGSAYVIGTSEEVDSEGADGPNDAAKPGRRHRDKSAAESEEWLTHFELLERSGEVVRSEDLLGQPYVVGFFFTLCPSICVNQNAKVQELQEKYRGRPLRLLSISCDPDVDRPAVLAEYAKRFNADPKQWLFLTGDMDYITRVAGEMYFLAASLRFHAEKFVLVDAQGNNVGFYTWSDPLQFNQLQRDIDKLLDEADAHSSK